MLLGASAHCTFFDLALALHVRCSMFRCPRGAGPPWARRRSRSRPASSNSQGCAVNISSSASVFDRLPELEDSFAAAASAAATFHAKNLPTSIHQALKVPWRPTQFRLDGPGPRQNLKLLQKHADQGGDIELTLDQVLQGRAGRALARTTCDTYGSHIRLILDFCKTLQAKPLPADRSTILRFISMFNNVRTLRGALAAWRQIHIRQHQPWALEGDPFYGLLHKAIGRLMAARQPRRALRKSGAIKIVRKAVDKGGVWLQVGCVVALAYVYQI